MMTINLNGRVTLREGVLGCGLLPSALSVARRGLAAVPPWKAMDGYVNITE